MSEWRSLEDCPDDGRLVWVWNKRRPHKSPEPKGADGGWWRQAKGYGLTGSPTHWMPLEVPDPPSQAREVHERPVSTP